MTKVTKGGNRAPAATSKPKRRTKTRPAGGAKGVAPKEAVKAAIRKMGARFKDEDFKASIGDFIKLLQLDRELEDEDAKEIKVTWVEPAESEIGK